MTADLKTLLSDDVLERIHNKAELAAEDAYSKDFDRRARDKARLDAWRDGIVSVLGPLVSSHDR